MSIEAGSILLDPTTSFTGGTAKAFTSLGQNGQIHEVVFDGTDYLTQSRASFKTKSPKISASAPNGYTQKRNEVIFKTPLALDNGNSTVNTVSIVLSADVETTEAEIETMLEYAAQLLADTDFSDFWKQQSLT